MDSELSSQISSGDRAHFLSLSPSLLVVVGADGYIRRLNLVAEQLLGWQRNELLSKPFMAFVHPEDRAITNRAINQAINGGPPMVFRNRYRRLDGGWQPLEWTVGEAQPTDSGPIVYCLARNMAPQQRVEQTLERSEQRFRAIFDQTFQFMGLLKPDGTLLEANETALTFGGVTADQVVGKPLWHTPWWQTSEPVQQRLRDAIAKAAQGEFVRYEVDILGAGSRTVTIDFSIKPLRNDAGDVILLIPEGRDITERKAAELKFQELNAKLEARVARRTADIKLYAEAVENMQDGFHLWHLENLDDARSFRLQLANPAAAQLLAVDDTWALGKSMDEILPNLADMPIPDLCRQAVVTGKKRDLGAIDYVTPAGGHRTLSVRIFPLLEQCLGILFEDVTEQHRFEQQLTAQKEQLKTIFDQAGVGIARLALDGQWIEANDKLCEI
ncbi:MAG: PAS domain-containing protein, partial [Cyanobacteria bacterium P01_D01_bin.128]